MTTYAIMASDIVFGNLGAESSTDKKMAAMASVQAELPTNQCDQLKSHLKAIKIICFGQWLRLSWWRGLLLIPEVRSSNPVINILYVDHLFAAVNCIEMTKIKKKRTGISHLIKRIYCVGIK